MDVTEYEKMFKLEETNWWFVGKRQIIMGLINKMILSQSLHKLGLLDVGCGTGIILDSLSKYGRAVGIDISPHALEFCRKRGHYLTYLEDASYLHFEDDSFDLVTALDVIEHIEEDSKVLREIWRVCKLGGFAIISVPAYKFLWSLHDEALGHKRRYSLIELKRKFESAGFQLKKISYTNMFIFPIVFCIRKIRRSFRGNGDIVSDSISLPNTLNRMMVLVYKLEALLLRRINLPFGVSLLCIGQKPGTGCRFDETRKP